jgi:hypothetical protein
MNALWKTVGILLPQLMLLLSAAADTSGAEMVCRQVKSGRLVIRDARCRHGERSVDLNQFVSPPAGTPGAPGALGPTGTVECAAGSAIRAIRPGGQVDCEPVPDGTGTLVGWVGDFYFFPPGGATGYVKISRDYVAPVDASAFVWTFCTYDASAADVPLTFSSAVQEHGGAISESSLTNPVVETSAPNRSVFATDVEKFDLVAGSTYDFGVYFFPTTGGPTGVILEGIPSPSGGYHADFCSVLVQVFRR